MKRNNCSVIGAILFALLVCSPVETANAVTTPSHPEYGAGHPSLNGAAAAVLGANFDDAQTFTLFATGLPNRTYTSISAAESDGNNARVWGGMHYPSTVAISAAYGHDIANWINENRMQLRVGNSDHDQDAAQPDAHDGEPRVTIRPFRLSDEESAFGGGELAVA